MKYCIIVVSLMGFFNQQDTKQSTQTQLQPHLVLGVKDESRIKLDSKTGNYLVTIVGLDGKDKVVTFEPATKVEVTVKVQVTYDDKLKKFKYRYTLSNGKTAIQSVRDFGVEIREAISNVEKPPNSLFMEMGKKAKDFWGNKIWAEWGFNSSDPDKGGVDPGKSEERCSFMSEGLPGIVECYADGDAKYYQFEEGEAPGDEEYPGPKPLDNCVRGKTIGPVSAPTNFDAVKFTEHLKLLLNGCISEKWITSEGLQEKLKKNIDEANLAMKGSKTSEGKKILQDLLTVVEQSKKELSCEARELLKCTIQYTLEQIR